MPRHIAWPYLAPLSLKLYSARSVVRLGMPLSVTLREAQDAEALVKVWELAKAHTPRVSKRGKKRSKPTSALPPLKRSKPTSALPPLEIFFWKVGRDLRDHLGEEDLSTTEDALQKTCDRKLCQECKGSTVEPAQVCAWTDQSGALDESIVLDRGRCLAPAKELFVFSAEAALRAYRACLTAGYEGPALQFTTCKGVSNKFLGISIDGTVEDVGPDGALTSIREVCLSVKTEDFNARDYLAIAYALTHECVAHGHCGQELSGRHSNRAFAFHDGWMDSIAVDVLTAEATRSGSPAAQNDVSRHGAQFVAEARRIHDRRQDHWSEGAPAPNIDRAAGVEALAAFRRLINLALDDSPPQDPPRTAADISLSASLAINASPAVSHLERSDFLDVIVERFNDPSDEAIESVVATNSGRAMVAAARKYLEDGLAAALVHAVLKIPPDSGLLVV